MAGPGEVQKDKNKEEEINTLNTSQIRETLSSLQKWDLPEGVTTKERRSQEEQRLIRDNIELNTHLQHQAREFYPEARAAEAAPGSPEQLEAPARLTFKDRVSRSMKNTSARRKNRLANYVSYDMVETIDEVKKSKDNAMALYDSSRQDDPLVESDDPAYLKTASGKKMPLKGVMEFADGFQVNKRGEPVTDDDIDYMEDDREYINDYLSGDVQKRRPYLDYMVRYMLDITVTPEMFRDEYFHRHFSEIKEIYDRQSSFESIYTDPINKPYFDNLPPGQREMLTASKDRLSAFSKVYTSKVGSYAVKHDSAAGSYIKEESDVLAYREKYNTDFSDFVNRQSAFDETENQAAEQFVERKFNEIYNNSANFITTAKHSDSGSPEGSEAIPGEIRFEKAVNEEEFQALEEIRDLISRRPEKYRAHREILDDTYQRLYRAYDVKSELKSKIWAYRRAADSSRTGRAGGSLQIGKIRDAAQKKIDELDDNLGEIDSRIYTFRDVIRHYTTGGITQQGEEYLRQRGIDPFARN